MSLSSKVPLATAVPVISSPQPHNRYYANMESVFFLVEETLFQVLKYPFVQGSLLFASMFQLPQAPGGCPEGQSKSSPIVLPGITAKDFETFLRLVHPLDFPFNPPSFGEAEWASILRIAKQWEFDAVEALALSKLSEYLANDERPIELILYGREFQVKDWILRGYRVLVYRDLSITDQEIALIGWEAAVRILRARENRVVTFEGFRIKSQVPCPTTRCPSTIHLPSPFIDCSNCHCGWSYGRIVEKQFAQFLASGTKSKDVGSIEDIFASEVSGMRY